MYSACITVTTAVNIRESNRGSTERTTYFTHPCFSLTVRKGADLTGALEVCEWIGAVRCSHMNSVIPATLRRTPGLLTKEPCVLWENCVRPQPFVSFGADPNPCLKQTSTRRRNQCLDPINYRAYLILCKRFLVWCLIVHCWQHEFSLLLGHYVAVHSHDIYLLSHHIGFRSSVFHSSSIFFICWPDAMHNSDSQSQHNCTYKFYD